MTAAAARVGEELAGHLRKSGRLEKKGSTVH